MENIVKAMPLPIIPIIIGVGVAGAVGAKLLTAFGEKLKNKKLGIIGLQGSGKTTLAEFLYNHKLPQKTASKVYQKDYGSRYFNDLGISINIIDGKGSRTSLYDYEEEKEILRNYDIILYLFDMSQLFIKTEKDKYLKRIRKELKAYNLRLANLQKERDASLQEERDNTSWHKKVIDTIKPSEPKLSEPKEKIFIGLGTFSDKITEEEKLQSAGIIKPIEELVKDMVCHHKIGFFNSLVGEKEANETVEYIFERLKEFYDKDKDVIDKGIDKIKKLLETKEELK